MRDIENEKDIELVVRKFYDKLLDDKFMAIHFDGINLENHLPRIIAFWSLILLGKEGYRENVFDKHIRLNINHKHFGIWVKYFSNAIDECFIGERANLAKQRAEILGYTFSSKFKP